MSIRTRLKHKKNLRLKDKFKLLITTPSVLTGGVSPVISTVITLPAGGFFAVSYSVEVSSGDLLVNSNRGYVMNTIDLATDELHRIGWFEKDEDLNLEITVNLPGTATLHYLDTWRRPYPIATATFT